MPQGQLQGFNLGSEQLLKLARVRFSPDPVAIRLPQQHPLIGPTVVLHGRNIKIHRDKRCSRELLFSDHIIAKK